MRCRSCGHIVKKGVYICPVCNSLVRVEDKCKLDSFEGGEALYKVFKVTAVIERVVLLVTIVYCLVYLLNFRAMYLVDWLTVLCFVSPLVSFMLCWLKDYLCACIEYNLSRYDKRKVSES